MTLFNQTRLTSMDADEIKIFENSVSKFISERAPREEILRWRSEGAVSRNLWREAGKAGLLGVSIPEDSGGIGGDFRHEVVIMRELGLRGATSFAIPLHNAIVAPYIYKYATEEQKRRWLPKVVSGEIVLAIAMTEPGAGSDLLGIRTTALREGNSYRINGQKTFISNGLHASLIVLAAKTNSNSGAKGISLFTIELDNAEKGFKRGRLLEKLGQEGRDTAELFFDDLIVPAENLLGGEEGRGFSMLMDNLPQERVVIAWQAMAMIEAALEHTLSFVKERRAFGRALFEFQNTQFKLAEYFSQAKAALVFLNYCTDLLMKGKLDTATASMAKLLITELQGKVVDECLQLHGGYGYMTEYPIADMYKDSRAFRIYGGTSEIMKLIIARSL